jgi:hypothetical protein
MVTKVEFTELQLKAALKMKRDGVKPVRISEFLRTTPLTSARHLAEYEAYGWEGYKRRRSEPDLEGKKIIELQKKLEAMFNKCAVMVELIHKGDIEICKEFVNVYECRDYTGLKELNDLTIESIIRKLKSEAQKRVWKNRFEVVAFER